MPVSLLCQAYQASTPPGLSFQPRSFVCRNNVWRQSRCQQRHSRSRHGPVSIHPHHPSICHQLIRYRPLCDCAVNRPRYLEGTPYEYQCVLHRREDPYNGTPPAHLPALVRGRTLVFGMDKPEDWEVLDDAARQARRREALTNFVGAQNLWFEEDGRLVRGAAPIEVYRNDYYANFEILEHNEYDEFYLDGQTMLRMFLMTEEERRQLPFKAVDDFELALGLREDVWRDYIQAKLKPMVEADQRERHPRLTREFTYRLLRTIEDPDGEVSQKELDQTFRRLMAPRYTDPARPALGNAAAQIRRTLENAHAAHAAQKQQRAQSAARSTASTTPPNRPVTPRVSVPAQGNSSAASASPRSTPVFRARPQNSSQVPRPGPRLSSRDMSGPTLTDPRYGGRPSGSSGVLAGNPPVHAPPLVRAATPTSNQGRLAQNLFGGTPFMGNLSPQARTAGALHPQGPPRSLTASPAHPAVAQPSPLQRKYQAASTPAPHGRGPPVALAPPTHATGEHGQSSLPVQQGFGLQTQQQRSPYERGSGHLPPLFVRPNPYVPNQVSHPVIPPRFITPGGNPYLGMQNPPPTNFGSLGQQPSSPLRHPAYGSVPRPGSSTIPRQPVQTAQHGQAAGPRPPIVAPGSPGNVNQQQQPQPVWDPATGQWVVRHPHVRHYSQ